MSKTARHVALFVGIVVVMVVWHRIDVACGMDGVMERALIGTLLYERAKEGGL